MVVATTTTVMENGCLRVPNVLFLYFFFFFQLDKIFFLLIRFFVYVRSPCHCYFVYIFTFLYRQKQTYERKRESAQTTIRHLQFYAFVDLLTNVSNSLCIIAEYVCIFLQIEQDY